jgi:hypothetical protein
MAGTPAKEAADAVDPGVDGGSGEVTGKQLRADYTKLVRCEVTERLKTIESAEGAERLAHILGLVRLATIAPTIVVARVNGVFVDRVDHSGVTLNGQARLERLAQPFRD